MTVHNSKQHPHDSLEPVTLNRRIGLYLLLFYGLGNILGAGIYVLVGKVAGEAGYGAPIAFLIASLAAAFTVFTYAELSARYPVSAGEAVYLYEGFKLKWLSILVGILLTLSGIASTATISHGFVGYFQQFWMLSEWILISGLIITLGLVSLWGIGESVKLAAALTILEIIGLLIIIWVGFGKDTDFIASYSGATSSYSGSQGKFEWESIHLSGVILGAFLAFYAFIGFEDMVNIAEEVEQPQRNLPLAAVMALVIATVLYALITWIAVTVVTPDELSKSDAPLALVFQRATGNNPFIISIISLFAVVNGALVQIIMGSRILYGMANRGWMPKPLANINRYTRTPILATTLVIIFTLAFALALPLISLAELTSFLVLTIFVLINVALIKIKDIDPTPSGVKLYPIWVPFSGAIISLIYIVSKIFLMMFE